jgi:hypothetical protein
MSECVIKTEPVSPEKKSKKMLEGHSRTTEFVEIVPEPKVEKRKKDKNSNKKKVESDDDYEEEYEPKKVGILKGYLIPFYLYRKIKRSSKQKSNKKSTRSLRKVEKRPK